MSKGTAVAALAATVALGVSSLSVQADSRYNFRVVASGLSRPTGIAVGGWQTLYFTEVPTPGVAGAGNNVSSFDGTTKTIISSGEPEPTDVVVSRDGSLYWTCKSAGVILERHNGQTSVLVSGLESPVGIAIDRSGGTLYFTEVPTPGVAGKDGGRNRVSMVDLRTERVRVIHSGDPEPTDVAVAPNGNVYWTCSSAGVIVEAKPTRRRG